MLNDFKNAFQRHNNGHVQLIIINVVVFLVMGVLLVVTTLIESPPAGESPAIWLYVEQLLTIPAPLLKFVTRPWTMITYAFMHGGFFHIFGNMLMLYWFGRLFVEYLGSDKLIAVYVLGALAGALAYLLVYNLVPYYMVRIPGLGMLGASAAVYAVTVAIATLLPDYTFFLLFIGPVKIKYIALVSIALSFMGIVGTNEGGNIAHLGGALIGFVYTKQLQAGVNWGSWITVTIDWFKDLFKPKPKVHVSYRRTATAEAPKQTTTAKASQAEIDAILDKISEKGYGSLSKDEKDKLANASKK